MVFSVIVPVYKTEPYLRQCIDSILSQTFSDFELIVVDDGSPDNSPAICDEYAAKDSRISVIHKQNGGLVSARKAGIQKASGEYIINVDSDDWLRANYLDDAYTIIKDSAPDIITFAVNYVSEETEQYDSEPIKAGLYKGDEIARNIYPKMLMTKDMKHMHYFLCAKVIRRNILLPHQLEVDERISMGEDVTAVMPSYLDAQSVYVSDTVGYNVRCHVDSMSRKYNPSHFGEILLGTEVLRSKVCEGREDYAAQIYRYEAFMFFILLVGAAAEGAKNQIGFIKSQWNGKYSIAFDKAEFEGITAKSKIAVKLLKAGHIKTAYMFLRFCSKLKGGV